jgi:mannose/fructose/N-acetylgalactosamine-specific phosphotransferase system component IID
MNSKKQLIRTPSAWLPLVMSSSAFVLLINYITMFGVTKQQDEGTAARIFQLLLVGQIPIIIFFAIKWLPKKQKQALQILTLQLIAGLLAFATVFFLEL